MSPEAPAVTAPELAGAAPAAATPVEVEVGGKTLKVDKDTAAAITEFKKSVSDAGIATKAQIDQLAAQVRELQPKSDPKAVPAAVKLSDLIFTDPDKAVQLIKDELRAELNGQLASTNAQADFWREFYSQNADLKDADWLVKSILGRDFKKFEKMQVPEAIKALAETVKGDILKLSPKKGGKEPKGELEGGNERQQKLPKEGETESKDSQPPSISSELRARRAARRAGTSRPAA